MNRSRLSGLTGAAALILALAGCAPAVGDGHASHASHGRGSLSPTQSAALEAARATTATFTDVAAAEAAGYASTVDSLGCFQNEEEGGMGLHYLREDLLDDTLDSQIPEALVYELDSSGKPEALVAHEYIVPVEAWQSPEAPELFGMALHKHPTLPLWVLHAWLFRDNRSGVFADYNPDVTMCPKGVPIFGVDLP